MGVANLRHLLFNSFKPDVVVAVIQYGRDNGIVRDFRSLKERRAAVAAVVAADARLPAIN
jgi:hypothetical protein